MFQALLALGSPVGECAASMEAMRRDARSSTYNNPMAVSQILPALHQKSYLAIKTKNCFNEDGKCSIISVHLFFPGCVVFSSRCVSSYRNSGAGAFRSRRGFTKWDQSDSDGGGGDVQRGDCSLLRGCAKGQFSVGGPGTSQGEKCWLHVSVYPHGVIFCVQKQEI